MKKINELKMDKSTGCISWKDQENEIKVILDHVLQAIIYKKEKIIIALAGKNDLPSELIGYLPNGKIQFKTHPPKGYLFSYLTEHPEIDTAVVCQGNQKNDGWYDWHFSIDKDTGELKRYCPAM